MSKSTLPRLKALREEMGKAGITAFIIPGTDRIGRNGCRNHQSGRTVDRFALFPASGSTVGGLGI